jgi:uncharacterized protein YdhG (YjbR/CyaY superfamily)
MMNDDVRRFIESIPADRRPLFERLRALIQNAYPDASLKLSYGVPTFKSKGGWVALGYWKGGVSIHTNGRHNIEEFNAAYPRIKTGTGTINLRVTDVVPEEALLAVIRRAMTGGGIRGGAAS